MGASAPATVTVRRQDTGDVLAVNPTVLRWFRPLLYGAHTVRFALTREEPQEGDVPYLRKGPDSHWCAAVELVEIPNLPQGRVLPFASLEARQ